VAKRVKAGADHDSWIPGLLQPGIPCPLTEAEVRHLYASQSMLAPADETQLAVSQPVLAGLVAPADFRLLAAGQAGADTRAQRHRPELWDGNAAAGYAATQLQELHLRVQQSATMLAEEGPWLREVLFAGWTGGDMKEAWCDLIGAVEALAGEAGTAHRSIMAHGPELPQGRAVGEAAAMLGEIVIFLEAGRSFGLKTKLTRRVWHQLIEASRVEGRAPRTLDEFRALRAMAELEESRNRFAARWRRTVESLSRPTVESLGHWPERAAQGLCSGNAHAARMEATAPAWAHVIAQRHKPHDSSQPPGDAAAAWRWRQWLQELERRAAISMTELQERLDRTGDDLRNLAAQIIEQETWAAQRERTGLRSQQALMGFVETIRKVGKGTGKRVPALLRQARQLLASARRAVPVWIMPLSRVYQSFDPRETKFDVVIIDEASQSDVTALAALYLGREHVVVGDKEQVTPDAVGQSLDEVQRLISIDLQGIPNSHLYDGQTSIYDLAETAFGGVVALREHFRCVPEIIQFSNPIQRILCWIKIRRMADQIRQEWRAERMNAMDSSEGTYEERPTIRSTWTRQRPARRRA
jgi:hypothetical protein